MPLNFQLESGSAAYAQPSEPLTNLSFGARYISYNNENRFLDQTNDLDLGMIVWPGGTLAETREDRFGFEFDDLYNPATNKPGLSDMMALANDQDAALSVILPTARYVGDLGTLQADLQGFLADLLGGSFGALPEPMILEIGSEYFANFTGSGKATAYGEIADLMVGEIASALNDPAINTTGADVVISVQAGKTFAEDAAIRGEMSDAALANVDMIIHHRFAFQPQGIDPRMAELSDIVSAWEEEVGDAGGDTPNLFVSAWNTVTLTRNGALDLFVDEEAARGNDIDPGSIDLTGRTDTAFERFWQDYLSTAAFGQEHAAYLLESFASYAEAGMDAGAVYGIDSPHPGALSWREGGEDYPFVGAEMMRMIYESVGDAHVLAAQKAYDPNDPLTLYGFENEDKLVVFLAAGLTPPGDIVLDLDGLGSGLRSVHAERLTSETPADWKAIFGIPDNPAVDESPEADAYAMGLREAVTPTLTADGLGLALKSPHEIVRLAFAKTAAGEAEIAGWSDAPALDLDPLPLPEVDATAEIPPDPDDSDPDMAEAVAAAAGGGGGMGAVLFEVVLLL